MDSAPGTAKDAARRLASRAIAQGFRPEALHEYRSADGGSIYWRIRAKRGDGEKWIRPMYLNGNGYELGEPKFPEGKPLYNLDRIAADPSARVWIVEGEKAADALAKLGATVTTSGGAASVEAADWTPLRGRDCIIWPDFDDAGQAYAGDVGNVLTGLGCNLACVDVEKLAVPPKGDAADWAESNPNATPGDLLALPLLPRQPTVHDLTAVDSEGRDWPVLGPSALYGLAGDVVRAIEPHTEADSAAILMQTLLAFGVYIGRNPFVPVEGDKHTTNLFALLVGDTSKGRKGTSWGRVRQVFESLSGWPSTVSGLSSGEGLKWNVRDSAEGKGDKAGDPGATDKRLLVIESEFSQVLRATSRAGNTLSATVREAWDSGNLRTLTKNDPITASGAHIGIVGHVTVDELRAELTETDRANGFANRFLFVCVRRSKALPFGGGAFDAESLTAKIGEAADLARRRNRIDMTDAARDVWARVYPTLSEGHGGLFGAVTARAEAQCLRLALVYALLEKAEAIDAPHLFAAFALWEYCEASARLIFGSALGDPVADSILRSLRCAGSVGMSRTELRDLFKRHQSGDRIGAALEMLRRKRLALLTAEATDGRPTERWRASHVAT